MRNVADTHALEIKDGNFLVRRTHPTIELAIALLKSAV